MWHDYLGDAWNVRITGGGIASKFAYRGQVTAERPCFSAPVAFLLDGTVYSTAAIRCVFSNSLRVLNASQDGFGFEAPATGETCFEASAPGDVQIYLGIGKAPPGTAVNLATLGACSLR